MSGDSAALPLSRLERAGPADAEAAGRLLDGHSGGNDVLPDVFAHPNGLG